MPVENKSTSKLTARQKAFIQYYLQSGNALQSYIRAGYSEKTAVNSASRLLLNSVIREEISRVQREEFQKNVATSEEVMDFFSRVMRGEVKDQFGLETSVADRIKAAQELAKRTIDIDNRIKGVGDPVVEIRLDCQQEFFHKKWAACRYLPDKWHPQNAKIQG